MAFLTTVVSEHAVLANGFGKILLLFHRHHNKENADEYKLPGGRMEENDEAKQALLREIKEETGLTRVKIILPVHTSMWDPSYRRYSVIYLARSYGDEPVVLQKAEAASYRWVSWDEAEAMKPGSKTFIGRNFYLGIAKARQVYALKGIEELNALES
jgi:8-oxo-dGTP pyrophosphatase MutT (NUDIX family)